ncbi:MAG: hypothetical protein AAGF54_14830 [Pseudomonadota bacterium]
MTQRNKRGFINKEQALRNLQVGRDAAIKIRTEAKISSREYRIAGELIIHIDALAKELTGDPMFFYLKGHG